MGIYSTMEITRPDALELIDDRATSDPASLVEALGRLDGPDLARLVRGGVNGLDDRAIEGILFQLVGDEWLNNFSIVADYDSTWHIKYRK